MLQLIVDYLVDNGVDENEVDHLVRQKYFDGKSILDLVTDHNVYYTGAAWRAAYSWVSGEDYKLLLEDIDFRWENLMA